MANVLYTNAKQETLDSLIDWDTDQIYVSLLSGYVFNDAHVDLADVTGSGGTILYSQELTGKTITGGVFDGDNLTFTSITPGQYIDSLVIYKYNADPALATLLIYIDQGAGLPMNTDGNNIELVWHPTLKIFRF